MSNYVSGLMARARTFSAARQLAVTGAERYFQSRLADPAYAKAYKKARRTVTPPPHTRFVRRSLIAAVTGMALATAFRWWLDRGVARASKAVL